MTMHARGRHGGAAEVPCVLGEASRTAGACSPTSAVGAKDAPPAMAPSYVLPKQIVAPAKDAALIEQHRKSLADAETAFSNEAQKMGTGAGVHEVRQP